jgi:aspartyl-tRNA(Asn)/glutamyl-tRNA(Gln) amidotransferase subunit A
MKYGLETYYIIAMSETSTCQAKYCGMRYGANDRPEGKSFNDYFSSVRSQNLGDEAKRRIIIGTFARMAGHRDAFYIKAMKIRTKIINEYKELFKTYDALISPTMPFIAPKFTEIEKMTPLQNYMADVMTVGPNLAGLPHVNIVAGKSEGMPVGMMTIGDHFKEGKLIRIGDFLEKNSNN